MGGSWKGRGRSRGTRSERAGTGAERCNQRAEGGDSDRLREEGDSSPRPDPNRETGLRLGPGEEESAEGLRFVIRCSNQLDTSGAPKRITRKGASHSAKWQKIIAGMRLAMTQTPVIVVLRAQMREMSSSMRQSRDFCFGSTRNSNAAMS